MSLRIVFDTNVLFSAIGWRGKPADCVELVRTHRIQGITCIEILDELAEKLSLKLAFTEEQIGVVLASLLTIFDVVPISGTIKGPQSDRDDDKILECAVVANATYVVSGDRKHLLSLKNFRGVKVVTPAELLEAIDKAAIN